MQYIKDVFWEVFQAVLPIALLVIVLLLIFIPGAGLLIGQFLVGTVMVIAGLGLFLIGLRVGLLPIGETIGSELPQLNSHVLALFIIFFVGVAVTVAEPNLQVLAAQVQTAFGDVITRHILAGLVAICVGFFITVAVVRNVLGIPISYFLIAGYALVFLLSYFVPAGFVPVSFDSAGVVTGPLTVPFVIAFGVGITSVLGGQRSVGDSFGFVALVALGPVLAMMLLGVIYG